MPKHTTENYVNESTRRDGSTEYVHDMDEIKVSFSKMFTNVPKVFVNVDGDSHFKITNKTKTGFRVRFRDNNFNSKNYTGDFDWEAVPQDVFSKNYGDE